MVAEPNGVGVLLAHARAQSRVLAERRAAAGTLPSLDVAALVQARPVHRRAQPVWGVTVLALVVLSGAGATWALIHRTAQSAALRPQVEPLGEALREEVRRAGAPGRVRSARRSRPAVVERPVVVRSAPARPATRALHRPVATVARRDGAASKGVVVFDDQPQGDLIIVIPKSKQGPLWTPKDLGKLMRRRAVGGGQ